MKTICFHSLSEMRSSCDLERSVDLTCFYQTSCLVNHVGMYSDELWQDLHQVKVQGPDNELDEVDLGHGTGGGIPVHHRRLGQPLGGLLVSLREELLQNAVGPLGVDSEGLHRVGDVRTVQDAVHQKLPVLWGLEGVPVLLLDHSRVQLEEHVHLGHHLEMVGHVRVQDAANDVLPHIPPDLVVLDIGEDVRVRL